MFHFACGRMEGMMGERELQGLEARINALSDGEINNVVPVLAATLRARAQERYAGHQEALTAIESVGLTEATDGQLLSLPDIETADARSVLLGLARHEEFHDDLDEALQHKQFVAFTGLEPIVLAALVTFVLSLKFELKVERERGHTRFKFAVGKEATALSFIGRLLGSGGGRGTEANGKAGE
jgi:hypothetical protein